MCVCEYDSIKEGIVALEITGYGVCGGGFKKLALYHKGYTPLKCNKRIYLGVDSLDPKVRRV